MNELKVWNFGRSQPGDGEMMAKFSVNPPNVYGFGHQAYYDHVVSCVAGDAPQLVDGLQGRKSLELINAIYESVETGKEDLPAVQAAALPARQPGMRRAAEISRPVERHVGIVDVTFGERVTVVQPCNLYGCTMGDNCFIGPIGRSRSR